MHYDIKVSPRDIPRTWTLLEDITIEGIQVPAGTHFDGASIPSIPYLRRVFPHGGAKMAGACAHDYLYRNCIGTREDADVVFLKAMIRNGVPKWRALMMYYGVRVFGGLVWVRGRR